MRTEFRFLLAIGLVILVILGTNLLFPPIPPTTVEEVRQGAGTEVSPPPTFEDTAVGVPVIPPSLTRAEAGADLPETGRPSPGGMPSATQPAVGPSERTVRVVGARYDLEFSTAGARLVRAVMSDFEALNGDGAVQLIRDPYEGVFGRKLVSGSTTIDLSRQVFHVEPEDGLDLIADPESRTLRFRFEHPTADFHFDVDYEFDPDGYGITVSGGSPQVDRGLVVTDLGSGLSFTEADSAGEARMVAHVHSHVTDGIESRPLDRAEAEVISGPLDWVALRNKFFVLGMFAGTRDDGTSQYLGAMSVEGRPDGLVSVSASEEIRTGGGFNHTYYLGPQEYDRLDELGRGFNDVNPYGWSFLRPIIRPFVSIILTVLVFFHEELAMTYGVALIAFGIVVRILLFPFFHKSMKAQMRNMAVQPLLKDIQTKYKEDKQKQQEEMMKLYKEHGFNPLAGCLPMLLPWPVLVALFFVFQNTIELRGVPFLWLPDLSAPDPLYILPILMGASMWLMQWVSTRTIDNPNPTMKMMMWVMPVVLVIFFFRFASGLNLYYAVFNIATIPQQVWIARERKKVQAEPAKKSLRRTKGNKLGKPRAGHR